MGLQRKLIKMLIQSMFGTWQDPGEFSARSKSKLYATELDVFADDLRFLYTSIQNLVPTGMMIAWGGNDAAAAPAGWLKMDGSGKVTTDYPNLFAVIGYKYGGTGATFYVPDVRGRVVLGAGTGTGGGASGTGLPVGGTALAARAAGEWGGIESVILAITNMPSHDHGDTVGRDLNHYHWTQHNHGATSDDNQIGNHEHGGAGTGNVYAVSVGSGNSWVVNGAAANRSEAITYSHVRADGAHNHDLWTSVDNGWRNDTDWSDNGRTNYPLNHNHDIPLQGGGAAHTNVQPFIVANGLIKT